MTCYLLLGSNDDDISRTNFSNLSFGDLTASKKNSAQFYVIFSFFVFMLGFSAYGHYMNYKVSLIIFFCILCFKKKKQYEKLKRREFLAADKIHKEAHNIQDILAILVPKFIQRELDKAKSGGSFISEQPQNDVAVLFCDFCDFDQMINQEGTNIVKILDEIFRNFDHFCLKHGIQKIEVSF